LFPVVVRTNVPSGERKKEKKRERAKAGLVPPEARAHWDHRPPLWGKKKGKKKKRGGGERKGEEKGVVGVDRWQVKSGGMGTCRESKKGGERGGGKKKEK